MIKVAYWITEKEGWVFECRNRRNLLVAPSGKYVWFMAAGPRGNHLLLLCRACCSCLKFQENLNTPCLLATRGSTPYFYKGMKPRRERRGTFLISDLCFWFLYTSLPVHSNLLIAHVHFKLTFSTYMFSNVFDRVHPAMKISCSFMLVMWASFVFLLPLCFLDQQTDGKLVFSHFFSFLLYVSFSFQCFTAVAEFSFASMEFDVVVEKAGFNLQQGAK